MSLNQNTFTSAKHARLPLPFCEGILKQPRQPKSRIFVSTYISITLTLFQSQICLKFVSVPWPGAHKYVILPISRVPSLFYAVSFQPSWLLQPLTCFCGPLAPGNTKENAVNHLSWKKTGVPTTMGARRDLYPEGIAKAISQRYIAKNILKCHSAPHTTPIWAT